MARDTLKESERIAYPVGSMRRQGWRGKSWIDGDDLEQQGAHDTCITSAYLTSIVEKTHQNRPKGPMPNLRKALSFCSIPKALPPVFLAQATR